jgi:hypothetical protein
MKTAGLFLLLAALPAFSSDYFPLKTGSYWVYQCENSRGLILNYDSVVITGSFQYRGMDVFVKKEYLFDEYNVLADSGEKLYQGAGFLDDGERIYLVPADTSLDFYSDSAYAFRHGWQDGRSWTDPRMAVTWNVHYAGPESPLYERFDSCYYVQLDTFTRNGTYVAPGVGVVDFMYCPDGRSVLLRSNLAGVDTRQRRPITAVSGIHIEPNPAMDFFRIDVTDFSEMALFSLDGRKVRTFTPGKGLKHGTGGLPQGVYIINVSSHGTKMSRSINIVR